MASTETFPGRHRPELLLVCGLVALLGNLAPIATLAIAAGIVEHDMIADTISDLGRGSHKWIMDTGFYLNSAALLALAIAAAHLHPGRAGWSLGIFALALLALLTTMIGLWDHFHSAIDGADDLTVHTWLTFGLAPLYLAGPLLMAPGAARLHPWMRLSFRASAALWILFAVAFVLAPTSIDGLLEKIAVTATYGWTLPLAWMFLREGRRSAA
ncbi:MAG: DUF998 domain-containing protein [Roseicyclus sp.]